MPVQFVIPGYPDAFKNDSSVLMDSMPITIICIFTHIMCIWDNIKEMPLTFFKTGTCIVRHGFYCFFSFIFAQFTVPAGKKVKLFTVAKATVAKACSKKHSIQIISH